MGAWGSGPFDNDEAGDWAWEADDADDAAAFVLQTLREASDTGDPLDAGAASRAVAAAAWLASGLPDATIALDGEGPESAPPTADDAQRAAATAALTRVLADDSEWRELWEEAGGSEAIQHAERLLAALRA